MFNDDLGVNSTVAAILARWAPHKRSGLLPCLIEVQEETGWLSPQVCRQVAEALRIPLADVFGVVEFYALLYDHPVGRVIVRVCDDVSCYINGSKAVVAACEHFLGVQAGETTPDGQYTLEVHPCLGRCERAPFMLINDREVGPVKPEEVGRVLGVGC